MERTSTVKPHDLDLKIGIVQMAKMKLANLKLSLVWSRNSSESGEGTGFFISFLTST